MDLFTGIFVGWSIGFSGYILIKIKGKNKYKVKYFDITDRVVKNKKMKNNINERIKSTIK